MLKHLRWCGLFIFALSQSIFCAQVGEKLWLGLNAETPLETKNQWLFLVFTQLRFINQSHPLQNGLIEGGIGRQITPKSRVWVGYRFSALSPINDFHDENRLFQQVIYRHHFISHYRLAVRSRLEELMMSHQPGLAVRLRERLSLNTPHEVIKHIFPGFYEEAFFQLNKTVYTSRHFISENRVFAGFYWIPDPRHFWEIGYINQYQFATPQQSQNQLYHILSVTLNFL